MAAPVVRSLTNTANATGTSHVLAAPPTIVAGDILVAVLSVGSNAAFTSSPSGWTQRVTRASTTVVMTEVWTKTATSGDVGAVSYTWGHGSSVVLGGTLLAVSGSSETGLLTASNNGNVVAYNVASLTTTSADSLLIFGASSQNYLAAPYSPNVAWTEVADSITGTATTDRTHTTLTQVKAATGATPTTTVTTASATGNWTSVLMALPSATANAVPTVAAISNQTVAPGATTTITAVGSDGDGTVASYAWTVLSTQQPATITGAGSATVTVTMPGKPATVVLQVVATDNLGATSTPRLVTVTGAGSGTANKWVRTVGGKAAVASRRRTS